MIWETAIVSIAAITCVAIYCRTQVERDHAARAANKRTSDALETTAEMLRDTANTWARRRAQDDASRQRFPDFGGIDPTLGAQANNPHPFGKKPTLVSPPPEGGAA